MVLFQDVVGKPTEPVTVRWDVDDVLLYAVSIGAGQEPADELHLTTENTAGVTLRPVPSFAAILGQRAKWPVYGEFDMARLVHAEQRVELHAPLATSGEVQMRAVVEAMHDKGTSAVVWTRVDAVDTSSGAPAFTTLSASFIHGEGGFGGPRGTAGSWVVPDRAPDDTVRMRTRPEQALLYRLNGDRNPLHADPAFAARGGFDRPILHGLCTFGFSVRAALRALCPDDPTRIVELGGRFSAPTWPGEELVVDLWSEGDRAWFRTGTADGRSVIERGSIRLRTP